MDKKIYVPSHKTAQEIGIFSPFEPGTRVLPSGFQADPRFKPLPVDIIFEKDVAVTLRDGIKIYVDVFRPVGSEKVPVIVAWSPYGKAGGTSDTVTNLFATFGLASSSVSGLEKFEAPDPAYWCAHGYAVCNPDARGIDHSEGDSVLFGRQEGQDCHDLIEWLAKQDWCTGQVGMSGTSYLAAAQWFTAAEQPPHLAAINPWEGFNDVYRDLAMRGAIPDLAFTERLQLNFAGANRREDVVAEAKEYPLFNDLWQDKVARLDRVEVPAYIVASYSNTLHTPGTFRAWRKIASKDKWLRIHNTLEWPDYYDDAHKDELRRFFDRYLKGEKNNWEETPRVRYAMLDMEGGDRINLPANDFPPLGVTYLRHYLDAGPRTVGTDLPESPAEAVYDTQSGPGLVSFTMRFDRQTEIVGYPKAKLWVEARNADDMDLFLMIEKLHANGSQLQQFTMSNQTARMLDFTERGGSVLRYKGASGKLRVSARHLDETLSSDEIPVQSFDRVEKLSPGEIVEIEVELFPIGLTFYAGEQLRFVISAQDRVGSIMLGVDNYLAENSGQHVIHTGGSRASYLQLPIRLS